VSPAPPEIKSRTWSRRDALDKAAIITELLGLFGTRPDDTLPDGRGVR
jgi:hypothetical protein